MNHSQDLIAAASLILFLLGIVHIRHKEVVGKTFTAVLWGIAGLGLGAVILTATVTTGLRHLITDADWGGVNVALTLTVWAAIVGWYEAFHAGRRGRGHYNSHYLRTPLAVGVTLLLAPLWDIHKIAIAGWGVLLAGAAVILAIENKGETKRFTTVVAILGGGGLALTVGGLVGTLVHSSLWGVGVPLILAILFGAMTALQAFHPEHRRYHHMKTTLCGAAAGMCLVLAFGTAGAKALHWGSDRTVSTVAHVTRTGPAGTGNPFAPFVRDLVSSLPGGHPGRRA